MKRISFNIPYLAGSDKASLIASLESLQHCGNRMFSKKCTELLEERYGFKKAFLTPSCTSAMEMAALLANLQPGDEVIVPSWTFSSTANAAVLMGAKPVFCDVKTDTMNIDVDKIEPLITERTKMIAPIDYAGIPCDISPIMALAKKYDLLVMQDAAQSLHSKYKGQYNGTIADFVAYSFHETKNISCGEGGALCINNPKFFKRADIVQEKGTDRSMVIRGLKSKYGWVDKGSSYLLADLLAALLYSQLEHAQYITDERGRVDAAYRDLYAPYEAAGELQTPKIPSYATINNHAFFVIFDTEANQKTFLHELTTNYNVFPYIGYMPLHSSVMGQKFGYKPDDVPITEEASKRLVRLPFYTALANDGLDYCLASMTRTLNKIYGH